jgi:flavin-dependent dehydrogenase
MALAAAGREVVVVERTDYRGPRVGETLPPAATPILARLGLTDELKAVPHLRCPGTVSCWGREEPAINDYLFDPDGDGWHVDRGAFDAVLAGKAAAAGARVLVGFEVRSCRWDGSGWDVEAVGPCGECRFQALDLIDAAGRRPWPGRPSQRRCFDRQVALVGTFELLGRGDQADRRTWIEAVRCGWWYSSALPGNRLVAGYLTDADLLRAPVAARSALWEVLLGETRFTRDRLRSGMPVEGLSVVAASSSIAEPIDGERYVAVGDAACTIDPLSSQGILYALTSGLGAAAALLGQNRPPAMREYSDAIGVRFRDDLRTRQRFCQAERRWPDSPFWRRRAGTPTSLDTAT